MLQNLFNWAYIFLMRSIVFAGVFAFAASSAMAMFVPVDFYSQATDRYSTFSAAATAGGAQTLGGVDFVFPTTGNDVWRTFSLGGGTHVLNVTGLNVSRATALHSLFNLDWGQVGGEYLRVEVFGTNGAYFSKFLVGGTDVRDRQDTINWANTINGTTSVNVRYVAPARIDKQEMVLPSSFLTETVTAIRVTDSGAFNFQRSLLYGMSFETSPVPEPFTIAGLGVGLLAILRKKRA